MFQRTHEMHLDLVDAAGQLVQSARLEDDAFMACYEDMVFTAICAGHVVNDDRFPTVTIEPIWAREGPPVLSGITMNLPPVTKYYGLHVFADLAYGFDRPASDALEVRDAQLAESVLWRLRAEPRQASPPRRRHITVRRQPYPLHRETLDRWGIPHVTVAPKPFALYVSKSVIAELREETVHSLHIERADILTGRVIQDPEGSVAVLVTGRTPATVDGQGTPASFRFSSLTFAAARAESLARDPDCTIVGWTHNHPACRDCPIAEPYCLSDTVFFSLADRQVHRTSFGAPYEIGLVLGKGQHKSPMEPIVRAYAWHDGTIHEQPLHVY